MDGTVNLDNCSGIFIAEADTAEPFSVGLKVGKTTHYLKAENRLELDNWSRVLKPFVQASQAYIPRRTSSSSSVSSSESDVFVHGEFLTLKNSDLDDNPHPPMWLCLGILELGNRRIRGSQSIRNWQWK